jgi:hypothetical protein
MSTDRPPGEIDNLQASFVEAVTAAQPANGVSA